MLEDADSDEADSVEDTRISHFGAGIEKTEKKEEARVINALANRDWRESSRAKRQKSGIPRREGQGSGSGSTKEVFDSEATGPKYGLNIAKPKDAGEMVVEGEAPETDDTTAMSMAATASPATEPATRQVTTPAANGDTPSVADQEALDRLLGHTSNHQASVIRPPSPPPTEDEAFRSSYTSAPRMATLAEYAATPVEGYGAAILRGYLKPNETLESRTTANGMGKKTDTPVRRPGLLGLGAKDAGVEGVELGAWNARGLKRPPGSKGPRMEEVVYNPIALRNKKTGELVTEEELKGKLESQAVREVEGRGSGRDYDSERGRDGKERRLLKDRADESDGKDRWRRERDRRDDRGGEDDDKYRRSKRDKDDRRDRDRDHDRDRRGRRSKYDEESESESDRKHRRRREDRNDRDKYDSRDRERDSDRHRHRQRDDDKERHRDKDRDRRR